MTHEPKAPTIVHVAPPGDAVTVCDVAAAPACAAETDSVTDASPMTTPGAPGTFGLAVGVTAADGADAADVPPALLAVAVNVYAVPLLRPATRHEPDAPTIVQLAPPGDAVTVCDVAGHASMASATDTLTDRSPTTTSGIAGTLGGGVGVTGADGADAAEVPPALLAVAVNVYSVPFVRPDTTHEPKAPAIVQLAPPGVAVTVSDVAAAPACAAEIDALTAPSPTTTAGTDGTFGSIAPDVITRLPVPVLDTATNRPLANTTEFQ